MFYLSNATHSTRVSKAKELTRRVRKRVRGGGGKGGEDEEEKGAPRPQANAARRR